MVKNLSYITSSTTLHCTSQHITFPPLPNQAHLNALVSFPPLALSVQAKSGHHTDTHSSVGIIRDLDTLYIIFQAGGSLPNTPLRTPRSFYFPPSAANNSISGIYRVSQKMLPCCWNRLKHGSIFFGTHGII